MEQKEEWKSIIGYEGLYEVSNYGRVKSLLKSNIYFNNKDGIILKQDTSDRGYHTVVLYKDKKGKRKRVHRLVAEAFIPNYENKPYIDHIDTDVHNNNVSNLRWCSAKENSNNKITLARISLGALKAQKTKNKRGSIGAQRKVYQFSLNGELIKIWDSLIDAYNGTKIHGISAAVKDRVKSSGGYLWSYESHKEKYIPRIYKSKKIALYDDNMMLIKVFDNAIHASKELNINRQRIYDCCGGFCLSTKGYILRYYKE